MNKIIALSTIIVSILLVVSILLQNRRSGLSGTFGGDMSGYYTRRGFEKFLVSFSIVLSFLFIVLSIWNLFLAK